MKLNLGCGRDIREGYLNLDIDTSNGAEFIDLEVSPLPFDDGSVSEILLYSVLEHLRVDPVVFMKEEIHRILTSDGVVKVKLPWFNPIITHIRFFHTKKYFTPLRDYFKLIECKYVFKSFMRYFPYVHIQCCYTLKKRCNSGK